MPTQGNKKGSQCCCSGNNGCALGCDLCNYIMVLKFCGTLAIADHNQYDFGFVDNEPHDIGIYTNNLTDCACNIVVVGDVAAGCPNLVSSLVDQYGADCVTTMQTTVMDNVVLDGCGDPSNPGLVRFTIGALNGAPLNGISYDIYRWCPEDQGGGCCKFQSGTPTLVARRLQNGIRRVMQNGKDRLIQTSSAYIEWHNPCCAADTTPPSFCNSCCICQVAPFNFYYPLWKITATGIQDNPWYVDPIFGAGQPSCNCNQFNGIFFLRYVGAECQYVSTVQVAGAIDNATAPPGISCRSDSTFALTGFGSNAQYPKWYLTCAGLFANMLGTGLAGGTRLSAAVGGVGGPFATAGLNNCSHHAISETLFQYVFPPNGVDPLPPAYYYDTPCVGWNATFILEPVGDPVICTPVMGMMAARALGKAALTAMQTMQPKIQNKAKEKGRCTYLGDPTEKKTGCNGWKCQHDCDHPNPTKKTLHMIAVPGGNCQTCPDWSDHIEPDELFPENK